MICELHREHKPKNFTVEAHHVIPVAWQLFYKPAVEPFPGTDPSGRGHLWDARTATLCPTGHRNIHAYIVAEMHSRASGAPLPNFPAATRALAFLALSRFAEVGGDLDALIAAHEWGQS